MNWSDAWETTKREIAERWIAFAQEAREGFERQLGSLSEGWRHVLRRYANEGWYPDIWGQEIAGLVAYLEEGDLPSIQRMFEDHFQGRARGIIETICTWYPNRDRILHEALTAHEEGRYVLSIPVFLAQADGLFRQSVGQVGVNLHGSRAAQALSEMLEGPVIALDAAFLEPFAADVPLSLSERPRLALANFVGLNRHRVMHGEDCEYGSRTNSLKAISWLWYVACSVERIERKRESSARGSNDEETDTES